MKILTDDEIEKQIDGLLIDIADGTWDGIRYGTTTETEIAEFYDNWINRQRDNLLVQRMQDIKDFKYWAESYCVVTNIPQRECGHCWQSFKQLVEG